MKKTDVVKQYTTPIAAPAFVQGPHRFKRREYLNITYRTDREALEKLVPEPLEIDQPLGAVVPHQSGSFTVTNERVVFYSIHQDTYSSTGLSSAGFPTIMS